MIVLYVVTAHHVSQMGFHSYKRRKNGKGIQSHIILCNQDGLIFFFLILTLKHIFKFFNVWVSWFFLWEVDKFTTARLLILLSLASSYQKENFLIPRDSGHCFIWGTRIKVIKRMDSHNSFKAFPLFSSQRITSEIGRTSTHFLSGCVCGRNHSAYFQCKWINSLSSL